MAFTFNSQDIQAATKNLAFAGDYLVKVQSAEYQGKEDNQQRKTYGADKFQVVFEVMDGSEKGATIRHFFMDDSSITAYTPFRYREINALLAGIGGINENTVINLENVAEFLPEKILSVRVTEFDKFTTNKGRVAWSPVASAFGAPIKESVPDKSNPRPSENAADASINNFGAGATPTNAASPFDMPAGQDDPFM